MYKDHPVFIAPEDINIKIWRYMNLYKFLDLLDKKALYFSRLDLMPDPFEGKVSEAMVKAMRSDLQMGSIASNILNGMDDLRKGLFVNCWHINECESAAMWKVYLKNQEGIAVQSTVKRLQDSLELHKESEVYVGKINYTNYKKELMDMRNVFNICMNKRKSFEHERELRAVTMQIPVNENKEKEFKVEPANGRYIKIDLTVLIEKIFVAPEIPAWQRQLTETIVEKYGFSKKIVEASEMDERPNYY